MRETNPSPGIIATFAHELKAYEIAHRYHFEQKRKFSFEPYFIHLVRTSCIAKEYEPDESKHPLLGTVAICHDLLEDTSYSDLEVDFPKVVCEAVYSLTQPQGLPKEERRAVYIEQMKVASPAALQVSISDKIDNLRCSRRDVRFGDKFESWKESYGRYYKSLQGVYHTSNLSSAIVDEFDYLLWKFDRL